MTEDPKVIQLRKMLGKKAVGLLQEGKAFLSCWRGSSPWNYYVSPTGEDWDMLWHSCEKKPVPDMSMFEKLSDSKDSIKLSLSLSEIGKSFKTIYVLKPEYRNEQKNS